MRAKRNEKPLSIALLDIDHFKAVNDTHGHEVGDSVLKSVVSVIKENIRVEDEVGRYGGEEFIFLLPETSVTTSQAVLERIRDAIEKREFTTESGSTIKTTVSIGISEVNKEDESSLDPAIHRADVSLYRAKDAGRNQIKIFE